MSRPYPILLMLAMSLPGAVRALGLGDIRVDSALNEPLSAQIDIVGATRDELAVLTARVANHELFQKYGADRPSFLSSATFKVGMDAQGRPVLNVRSADAFTDPVVSLVVDLRWGRNEVVREYPLLLDPAGFAAVRQAAENAVAVTGVAGTTPAPVAVATPTAAAHGQASARKAADTTATAPPLHAAAAAAAAAADTVSAATVSTVTASGVVHKVAAGETLRSIARHNGARNEAQIQRMMIATFRANPHAFEGNINRLHSGAVLTLPTSDAAASLSSADVRREIRSQMTTWRLDGRPAPTRVLASQSTPPASASLSAAQPAAVQHAASVALPPTATPPLAATQIATATQPATASPPATASAPATVDAPADNADAVLKSRVQSLEHALDDMNKQLANENARIKDLSQEAAEAAARSNKPAAATTVVAHAAPQVAAATAPHAESSSAIFGPVAATLAFLIAGFAYIRRRLTPRSDANSAVVESVPVTVDAPAAAPVAIAAAPPVKPPVMREAPLAAAPQRAVPPSAPIAQPMKLARASDFVSASETTSNLEIDIEALERSYLDSMSMEAATESPTVKTVALENADTATVAVDPLDLDSTLMNHDLNTAVMDTKGLDIDAAKMAVDSNHLDYNLLDLDATSQHVHMPSDLFNHPVTAERRTNIVDVLKMAIERDPKRLDLRLKLLETYYIAAASNQRSFMDVVRKLARERESLSAEDWNKVQMMGREIAADDILFADSAGDNLADCA